MQKGMFDHDTVMLDIRGVFTGAAAMRGGVVTFAASRPIQRSKVTGTIDGSTAIFRIMPVEGFDAEQRPFLTATILAEAV